jgi:hypothetical protein
MLLCSFEKLMYSATKRDCRRNFAKNLYSNEFINVNVLIHSFNTLILPMRQGRRGHPMRQD